MAPATVPIGTMTVLVDPPESSNFWVIDCNSFGETLEGSPVSTALLTAAVRPAAFGPLGLIPNLSTNSVDAAAPIEALDGGSLDVANPWLGTGSENRKDRRALFLSSSSSTDKF